MSINQDVDSGLVVVTDTNRQVLLTNLIQKLVKERKEPDLDLRIYNEEEFEKIIPFKKKTSAEVPPIKSTTYNTSTQTHTHTHTHTQKQDEIEFYYHMVHLKKFGLKWEDTSYEFKYSVELSTDKNNW